MSASADRTLGIWRLHDGECEAMFSGHKNWVHAVRISAPSRDTGGSRSGSRYASQRCLLLKSFARAPAGVRPPRRRAHCLRLR